MVIVIGGCTQTQTQTTGSAKIMTIDIDPTNPAVADRITITATVENTTTCKIEKTTFFSGGSSGGTMDRVDTTHYNYSFIGSLKNDLVWCTVIAVDTNGKTAIDDTVIEVGTINLTQTAVTISLITKIPQNPTEDDHQIIIGATVMGEHPISSVQLAYVQVIGTASGGSGDTMTNTLLDTYEGTITIGMGETAMKGATILYKIVAQDNLGNTAISPTMSFTIL